MSSKTAVVTGGARGIGRAIANMLQARGDRVFVIDYLPTTDDAVQSLQQASIGYIQADIASVTSIKQGFAQLSTLTSTIDIMVLNAGVTQDNLALRMSENDWDRVLDVNLKGAFFCAQEALKRMMKQPVSYLIAISSIVGRCGNPGQANYAASKAGIMALTKTLSQEYASRHVLVNAIAPGFIQTAMTDRLPEEIKQKALEHIPLRRFGTPDDIAQLVVFLSSGSADYITGQIIEVTGGM